MHVMGLTGQGKSKLLASYVTQLLRQDIPFALIDPHADLADDILGLLHDEGYFDRPEAHERLWYIDFSRLDRFLPFNVLNQPYETHALAQHILEVAERVWPSLGEGQAPQFENVVLASVVVLIENELPLTALPRLLTDKSYRQSLLKIVSDPQILSFFADRFDRWGKDTPLLLESTLRRAFLLSFSPILRYSLGQRDNVLNFRELMDRKISVIFNLGGLDEQTQRFLGCLLTVGFEQAALSRADVSPSDRTPYHLVVDEFSSFAAQSEQAMIRVLSLARKHGLFLKLINQTASQLSLRLQGALQNTVEIAFRLGRDDAVWAAPRFGRVNPSLVKHDVTDPAWQGRTHPLYYTVQEEQEGWAQALEDLRPREAYVRMGRRTVQIRTDRVQPTPDAEALRAIKERYAQTLMTPRDAITEATPPRSAGGEVEVFRAVTVPLEDRDPPFSRATGSSHLQRVARAVGSREGRKSTT